jgi:hypothetical protein
VRPVRAANIILFLVLFKKELWNLQSIRLSPPAGIGSAWAMLTLEASAVPPQPSVILFSFSEALIIIVRISWYRPYSAMSSISTPPPSSLNLRKIDEHDNVMGVIGVAPSFRSVNASLTVSPLKKPEPPSFKAKRITRIPVVGEKLPPDEEA